MRRLHARVFGVLLLLACSDEPLFVLRPAVASPDSNFSMGLLLNHSFPRMETLRNCSPCEKFDFELLSGETIKVHASLDPPYEIHARDVVSSVIREHHSFLTVDDSYFSLECRLTLETIERIRVDEDARGRAGILYAFKQGKLLATGTSPEGPCMLGNATEIRELEVRASELGLSPEIIMLSEEERMRAREQGADLVIDLINFHLCGENPVDDRIDLSELRILVPDSRRDEITCAF